ncbi:hypothetical protein [Kitasatospora sp. NPDC057738]|uniref:hypothetical protein n=1 Tax=Kitasatospora sp. NPDC057738 TaxID=3346233 RepID=UPI0036CEA9E9
MAVRGAAVPVVVGEAVGDVGVDSGEVVAVGVGLGEVVGVGLTSADTCTGAGLSLLVSAAAVALPPAITTTAPMIAHV